MDVKNIDVLYQKASAYIDQARQTIYRTIDIEMVKAYWCIGRDIIEEEQEALALSLFASYPSLTLVKINSRDVW